MEDSGALPLEMDVKDLAMGDLIDLCVYEQVVKKHGTNDVLVKFDLKHELMLDQAVVVVKLWKHDLERESMGPRTERQYCFISLALLQKDAGWWEWSRQNSKKKVKNQEQTWKSMGIR